MRHLHILDIVDHYDMFNFILHKVQVNQLKTTKLIKAIKLVLLGLSEHYTLKCMPLTNERIEWAISFEKQVFVIYSVGEEQMNLMYHKKTIY